MSASASPPIPPAEQPGLTFATQHGWGALTRGEGCLRRFHVGFPTESAATEYARGVA